jgi:hypothetical protein
MTNRLAGYALALVMTLIATPVVAQEVTWPAPVAAGGAMPATWNGIVSPTPTDWVGLYAPEGCDFCFIEWIYVSCSQVPHIPRPAGTCGFVVPSSVPPGLYELRLYAADGFSRLATSPPFEIVDGRGR